MQDKVALALLQSMAATNQQTNSQSAKDLVKPSSVGSLLHHNSAVSPLVSFHPIPSEYTFGCHAFLVNSYNFAACEDFQNYHCPNIDVQSSKADLTFCSRLLAQTILCKATNR